MVYDHLDGQSVVDIDEESVGSLPIKAGRVHSSYGLYEGCEVTVFAETAKDFK